MPTAAEARTHAKEALDVWLRERLKSGAPLLRPGMHLVEDRAECTPIYPAPRVALAALLAMVRQEHAWSREQLAERVGVSLDDLAALEDPNGEAGAEVVAKGAEAVTSREFMRG